eukprot:CAMPEP_0194486450 /NCGR_PEP_ID=MMETSP0253-20130528/7095_1 /TAXON_ID=2966 /ORGANISM="Noctiluca scintillans" /LENGTH=184 /DNA_ID=CAMNT_0039326541 /DNA_START=64 /DNA_END=618 /DNA_ORIENTATION=-
MGPSERYAVYAGQEIASIETELKDWFLQRQFSMERNIAMKATFDAHNFTGLAMANPSVPDTQKVLWADLTKGKPELEDSLSTNAKQMKADMYMNIFKDATDLDHPCRLEGSAYLRCLQDNFKEPAQKRSRICVPTFGSFDACRSALFKQQEAAIQTNLIKQDISDKRAQALFQRRSVLLDSQSS